MKKTQEEKDLEYLEKMKKCIIEDIERWRDISAILWSINRNSDWWKNKLQEMEDWFYWIPTKCSNNKKYIFNT